MQDVCQWTSQAGSLSPSVAIENCGADLQWSVENPDGSVANDSGDVSGYVFLLGESTVTYTLSDSTGAQVDECSFRVTVEDREAPVIEDCDQPLFNNAFVGTAGSDCTWSATGVRTITDNCDSELDVEVQFTNPDGSLTVIDMPQQSGTDVYEISYVFDLGVTTYTIYATDDAGNVTTCTYQLTVTDEEDPTIDCADLDAAYDTDAGSCDYTVQGAEFDPVVDDNCAVESVINDYNATSSLANAIFPVGSTTVVWTVTDESGNTATCAITVVVEDNEDPVFVNCPADTITVGNDFSNCEGGVNWSIPIATDNCEVASVTQFTGPAPGQILAVGLYDIGYEVIDGSGNVDTCEFVVEVIDVQEPIIGCPQDVTISTDADVCEWASQAGSLSPSVAIENCGADLQWSVENPDGSVANDSGDVSGYVFLLGESTVTYTLSDSTGAQVDECSFRVTVEDTEAPEISCPSNEVLSASAGDCFLTLSPELTDTEASDNCTVFGDLDISYEVQGPDNSLSGPLANGTDFDFAVGISQVTFTVVDESGNVSECTYTVEILDEEDPTITCAQLASAYDTDAGACDYTVQGDEFDPVVDDNCAVESVINDYNATSSLANEVFLVGSTTVVWTVTDESGNTATCEITVVVEDNENPVFVNCPDTITVGNNFSNCSGDVNWSEPIAEDNCEVAVARLEVRHPADSYR